MEIEWLERKYQDSALPTTPPLPQKKKKNKKEKENELI